MEKAKDLVNKAVEKHDSIFIPTGIVNWRCPTGSIAMDRILGGGIPGGRITQIYGEEGVGKTTLLYHAIAEAQKMGLTSVLVSQEGTYDAQYAAACGVDVDADTFVVYSADFAEVGLNLVVELLRSSDAKLIGIDSIAAVNPRVNVEKKQPIKDIDSGPNIGAKARVLSDFLDKSLIAMLRNDVMMIFINQWRTKIVTHGFGRSKLVPSGGQALQYYTTLKIKMYKDSANCDENKITSNIVIDKGKDWGIKRFHACKIEIADGRGVDKEKEVVRVGTELGIIKRAGAWYSYNGMKAQGVDGAADFLRNDDDMVANIIEQIYATDVTGISKEDIAAIEEEAVAVIEEE